MARIKLDGDASGLLAAQRKVRDSAREVDREFDRVLQTNKDLERQVKQQWERARPPLERYADKVRRLRQLEKEGVITQKQLANSIRRTADAFDRAADKKEDAFGQKGLAMLTRYAAGIGGVTAAINLARNSFARMDQMRTETAQKLKDQRLPGFGALATLTEDPQALERLFKFTEDARQKGLTSDQAAGLVFQLESSGNLTKENLGMFARATAANFFRDPREIADAVATLQANIGGTVGDTLDVMMAGAQQTKTLPAEFLQAMTEASQQAKELGLSRADIAAATTITTRTARSASIGGTQLRSFLTQVEKTRGTDFDISGATIDQILGNLQAQMASGATLREILGDRVEGITAARVLMANRAQLGGVQQDIQAGVAGDTFTRRLENFEANERVRTIMQQKVLEQQLDMAMEEQGLLKLRQQNAQLENEILMERQNLPVGQRMFRSMFGGGASFIGADAPGVSGAQDIGGLAGMSPIGLGIDQVDRMVRALNLLTTISQQTANNTEPGPTTIRRPE